MELFQCRRHRAQVALSEPGIGHAAKLFEDRPLDRALLAAIGAVPIDQSGRRRRRVGCFAQQAEDPHRLIGHREVLHAAIDVDIGTLSTKRLYALDRDQSRAPTWPIPVLGHDDDIGSRA